jgi:hypothetical protein
VKHLSLALLALLGLLLAHTASAQTINKCQAGKKKCVIKKVKGLLGCHAKVVSRQEVEIRPTPSPPG